MFEGSNLPYELLLLTTRQKNYAKKAFANNLSADIKLSKIQISKIIQSGGYLGSLLGEIADPLIKLVVPIITAAASANDAGVKKKYMVLQQQF